MASTFVWLFWVFDSVFCHVLGLIAFRRGRETRGASDDRALSCVCRRAIFAYLGAMFVALGSYVESCSLSRIATCLKRGFSLSVNPSWSTFTDT